jgi:type II secretory pathway pseudopilin PulG
MSSHFFHHSKATAGFGLIELLVSISIMMLVAGVILIRQNAFNGTALLEGQAYEMALAIREVQQNAVSASALGGNTRDMLGVYFDTDRNTTYRIFRDPEKNGSYQVSEEYGQQNYLDSRYEIKDIRVGCSAQATLAVMFERPNFDAKFYGGSGGSPIAAADVEIDVGSKNSDDVTVKTVSITAAGQITVGDSHCP